MIVAVRCNSWEVRFILSWTTILLNSPRWEAIISYLRIVWIKSYKSYKYFNLPCVLQTIWLARWWRRWWSLYWLLTVLKLKSMPNCMNKFCWLLRRMELFTRNLPIFRKKVWWCTVERRWILVCCVGLWLFLCWRVMTNWWMKIAVWIGMRVVLVIILSRSSNRSIWIWTKGNRIKRR